MNIRDTARIAMNYYQDLADANSRAASEWRRIHDDECEREAAEQEVEDARQSYASAGPLPLGPVDIPEDVDEVTAVRIVEASMSNDSPDSHEVGEDLDAEAELRCAKQIALSWAASDNGTNVHELVTNHHLDKDVVKRALKELVAAGELRTEGVKRGCRYFAVKADAAE